MSIDSMSELDGAMTMSIDSMSELMERSHDYVH